MAGKKIFIEYDIDSSDLKIANGETLSLTQQLRILKKELQRGDLKPEQFDILRKKIGDTEDQIAKTTVRSKDFFGVLSTLPGPVGAFGSSLLGVVDTLKVFSSFTFKDIKNSLGDIKDDVVEISNNFLGFDKTNKDVANSSKEAADNVDGLGRSLSNTAAEAGATGAVVGNATAKFTSLETNLAKTNLTLDDTLKAYDNLTKQGLDPLYAEIIDGNDVVEKASISVKGLKGETLKLTESQVAAVAAGKTLTVTTEGLVVAEKAATFWTTTLGNTIKGVLIATGIGVLIVLLGQLITLFADWVSGTKEAEAAQKQFNDELERTNTLLDLDLRAAKRRQDLRVAELKARGASEKEINDASLEGLKENFALKQQALVDATDLYNKTLKRTDENALKDLETIGKRQLELDQEVKDLRNQIKIAELQDDIKAAEKKKEQQKAANDKTIADNKAKNDKIIADNKSADEQLLALQQENAVLSLKTDRERQDKELANQKTNEENKIKALQISEEKKNKLLEQVRLKFDAKQNDLNVKRQEEDLKSAKEFARKREDIEIAAIEDKKKREDAERQIKLQRDLEDLEEDKEFIKLSEEQKEEVRKNIRQKYANEDREITKNRNKEEADDNLKKLDDELRFLQIRQEAIRAGTKAFYDGQRDILAAAEAREIAAAEGKEKEITAIKEKYVKLRKDLDNQEKMATLSAIGETIGAFAGLTSAIASSYDEEAKTSKAAFEKRKKLQIATATMSAASGIIQILAQPSTLPSPFDWIVKGVNAAALAIATAVQISNIKRTQFESTEGGGGGNAGNQLGRGYADGGIVRGPGGPKSDSIPARLSNGEAVMTSGAVTMFAPLLSMMNQMGGGAAFTSDLNVGLPDNPQVKNPAMEQQPVIMKTYVVESELTSTQQRQARLKDLSTL